MQYRSVIILAGVLLICVSSTALAARKSTGNPRYDAAVTRGVEFLKSNVTPGETTPEKVVLAAYALFKAGEPVESPIIQAGLKIVTDSIDSTGFHPHVPYDHIYESGLFAMFLADVNPAEYQPLIQVIANYVVSAQKPDGSWSESSTRPGDISMCQYAVLALWAAQRTGCQVSPEALDRSATWHLRNPNNDGGWAYRPGTNEGVGNGRSSRNTTMAAVSSMGVTRLLFYGTQKTEKKEKDEKLFGVLEKNVEETEASIGAAFPGYRPQNSNSALTSGIERGLAYETSHFAPVHVHELFPIYLYYSAERALSVSEVDKIAGQEWFTAYGEGLLTMQNEAGAWHEPRTGDIVGTSFAVLYFMRSTGQILKAIGLGLQKGNKGNPFGDKEKEKEPSSLDHLLESMENIKFGDLDVDKDLDIADEIVRSVTAIKDPEELVGQVDRLKKLVNHPNAEVRQPVIWALGRTGDFSLVPLILRGLRDPNIDVNVEAEMALRYIARKPNGFGLSDNPLAGAENGSAEDRVRVANQWRDKAHKSWSNWYFERRPFEDRDGFDELEALVPSSVGK